MEIVKLLKNLKEHALAFTHLSKKMGSFFVLFRLRHKNIELSIPTMPD